MNRSSRRESALISLGDGSRWGEVIRLTPDATGFMESSLFLADLLTGHEPWRSTQSAIRNPQSGGSWKEPGETPWRWRAEGLGGNFSSPVRLSAGRPSARVPFS